MRGKHESVPEKTQAGRHTGKIIGIVFAVVLGVVILASAGLGFYARQYSAVFPGVTMAGLPISGLTHSEVRQQLEEALPLWLDQETVTVVSDGEELLTFHPSEVGVTVDPSGEADRVWAVGRKTGWTGWFENGYVMLRCLLGNAPELSPSPVWSTSVVHSTVAALADRFDRLPEDGTWELDRTGLYATRHRDGRSLDRDALEAMLPGVISGVIEAPCEILPAKALDLRLLAEELPSECINAYYDKDEKKVMDGTPSAVLHVNAAIQAMEDAAPGQRVKLPAELTFPTHTAEELASMLFRDELGTATTKVGGSKIRKGNVQLSGQMVNGLILNDGEVFDYNLVVGERTEEKGYGSAPAYVAGKTESVVGGGICQTSSTIYLAALRSNLEIVERYAHRYISSYIDPGMDATVSWGGPEFRFKNDSGFPIRIDVTYQNDRITVSIRGTKLDDTYVKMTYEVLSSTGYETEYQETEELPWGTEKQLQNGYVGHVVKSYRNIYSGDGKLISSKLEEKSVYKSRNQIIGVGIAGRPAGGGSVAPTEPTLPPVDSSNISPDVSGTEPPQWLGSQEDSGQSAPTPEEDPTVPPAWVTQ